ncbi:MAG: class F sortase [Pseudonocardia sp.]
MAGTACLVAGVILLLPAAAAPPPPARASAPAAAGPAPAVPPRAGAVPVELVLPGRGVTAPVVAVVTGADGGLVIPEPPSTVGWWSPSALPGGAGGTTVIAGHVDSRSDGLGALSVLRAVEPGEPVVLRGADGRVIDYRVVARRQYVKADLPAEIFAVGGPPRLVLITCGGTFDRATRQYSDNVVVHAVPA